MITIEELIKDLQKKDQQAMVEVIIVETNGQCICLYVHKLAKQMTKFLQMFKV
jgi:hypothetical protein